MGKHASSRLRRLCGLLLAFFALLATTIIMPTLNTPSLTVYAATRGQTLVKPAVTLPPPTVTTTVQPPTPTPTTPPSYQLSVRPDVLSQDIRSCTATTPSDYSCFVTLTITPVLPATATVTWNADAGISGGGVLLGSDFPATVSITNLACPSVATSITFTAIISVNGAVLQSPTALAQWSCAIPPTATPSPTPTTAPTPTSTTAPSPTPGPTQPPSPGSTPGATPSPSATGTSALPTAIATVCPSPGAVKTSTTCSSTSRSTSTSPTKTTKGTPGTSGTSGTQGAASTPSPTTQAGALNTDSGGNNPPPASGNSGPLFLIASLMLAALALLIYLLSWGQRSIGERILSFVLPVALLRWLRR